MILDANNLILGRLATYAAKQALMGEEVNIVNCDRAIILGDPKIVLQKYQRSIKRGIPLKGPYFPRTSDRFVRRVVRGMLPYKQEKGKTAFKRVMTYVGVPKKFEGQKTLQPAQAKGKPGQRIAVGRLCSLLGGKR